MTTNREWHQVDSDGKSISTTVSSHFKIVAPPKTDIWRPSADKDDFNAPYTYTSIKSGEFKSISTTVSADWKTQYDQGGILILWPHVDKRKSKWMKIGIEYFNGKPNLGVVGCDRFSDWSLCPMPMIGMTHASFEVERIGQTLWVYHVFNGEKTALREVKWAFLEDREAEAEMQLGVYAAKPTPDADNADAGVEVIFRDLELNTNA